jgi:uncharacterized membrane protein
VSDLTRALIAGLPILIATLLACVEVVRRPDLSGGRRVVWLLGLVFIPVIGVAVYAVVRPLRSSTAAVADVAGPSDAERLVVAAERRQGGEIDDEEFCRVAADIGGGHDDVDGGSQPS